MSTWISSNTSPPPTAGGRIISVNSRPTDNSPFNSPNSANRQCRCGSGGEITLRAGRRLSYDWTCLLSDNRSMERVANSPWIHETVRIHSNRDERVEYEAFLSNFRCRAPPSPPHSFPAMVEQNWNTFSPLRQLQKKVSKAPHRIPLF
jgi:hypothetical protein